MDISLSLEITRYIITQVMKPSLFLNFAGDKALDPRVTFTRASSATFHDAQGVLQTAANDVPRFDHDPATTESLGLLIEEQRTNSIRNSTMQGAVAGTPGIQPTNWQLASGSNGITRTINGVFIEDGITCLEVNYSTGGGVTTGDGSIIFLPEAPTALSASSGQTWSGSVFLRLVAGSFVNLTNTIALLGFRNSAGILLEFASTPINPTSEPLRTQRIILTRTAVNTDIAAVSLTVFQFSYAAGVSINFTLRIGLPQLELGAFATSPIPTTTAAATRAADVAVMTGANFSSWHRADEGTLYTEASRLFPVPSGQFPVVFSISDGTTQNAITNGYITLNFAGLQIRSGNVVQADLFPSASVALRKLAGAYKVDDFAVSVNGGSVFTDTSGTIPVVNQARLGATGTGVNILNGTIRKIAYYPFRLPNAILQALTS